MGLPNHRSGDLVAARFLLDTHVLVRWLAQPGKLSREQRRILNATVSRLETVALSAITLLEVALLLGEGQMTMGDIELFASLQSNPWLEIFPITVDIAREVFSLGNSLRDPMDRTIVATARVHGLRLLTSDQRIVEFGLVSVVD